MALSNTTWKYEFVICCVNQVTHALVAGQEKKRVENSMLSAMKSLHAKWAIELFNHITLCEGGHVRWNGWSISGIFGRKYYQKNHKTQFLVSFIEYSNHLFLLKKELSAIREN